MENKYRSEEISIINSEKRPRIQHFVYRLTCRISDKHRLSESWCSLSSSITGNDSDLILGSLTDPINSEGPGLPGTLCGPGPVFGTSHGLKNVRGKKEQKSLQP